jgi:hypothetical protein
VDKPRVSTAIAEQIARSGGRSCNTREFAWLAADLLDARRRIAELEKDAERYMPKDDFVKWALDWRDIPEDQACKRCGGRGSIAYGNTATWRFVIGGSMITNDVCNLCWGSGNERRPWTDLRKLKPIAAQRQKEGE